jgi:hypothetical protein
MFNKPFTYWARLPLIPDKCKATLSIPMTLSLTRGLACTPGASLPKRSIRNAELPAIGVVVGGFRSVQKKNGVFANEFRSTIHMYMLLLLMGDMAALCDSHG